MTAKAHTTSDEAIRAQFASSEASVEEIDKLSTRAATLLTMRRGVLALGVTPAQIDIDGRDVPDDLPVLQLLLSIGGATHPQIAAASIIAKEKRDLPMKTLAEEFPHYGWETNTGYGTKTHQDGLKSHGITPHHRRSFKPIEALIKNEFS